MFFDAQVALEGASQALGSWFWMGASSCQVPVRSPRPSSSVSVTVEVGDLSFKA